MLPVAATGSSGFSGIRDHGIASDGQQRPEDGAADLQPLLDGEAAPIAAAPVCCQASRCASEQKNAVFEQQELTALSPNDRSYQITAVGA